MSDIMRINNGGHIRVIVALLLVGVLAVGLLSTSVLAQQATSGGGSGAPGNSNGGNGGSGGGSHPGNSGGGGGSGGCQVKYGPTELVPTSTTTETREIKIGSGNSGKPGETHLIQERTVTIIEHRRTVYTTCTCENTGQKETTSSTEVVGTSTRSSGWRTVSVVKG